MLAFIKDLQDVFMTRIKNLFFINFLISFLIWNYNISFLILLDSKMGIDNKILFLQNIPFDFYNFILYPFSITLIYVYIFPIINLFFNIIYYRFIDKYLKEFQNKQLEYYYKNKKDVEEIKLINTIFLEKELENRFNKESLDLNASINKEKEKENKLEREQNKIKENKLELQEKAISNYEKRNKIDELLKEIDSLKKEKRLLEKSTKNMDLEETENYPLIDIRQKLKRPNYYIVLPINSLDKRIKINSFKKADGSYLSFCEISDMVGSLLSLSVNKIDERFRITRWNFENNEKSIFIKELEDFGFKDITNDLNSINLNMLTGNEFFIVHINDLDIIRNISTDYNEAFNDI